MHLLICKTVEEGEGHCHQQQGKAERDNGDQHRLAEKLPDQLPVEGANGFTDPDFLGALFRPRGAQVHKIDAGQQQYKNADDGEHPYKFYIASCIDPVFELGI